MEALIKEAAKRVAAAKSLVISTGAGVSKESGIPTYRDEVDGLWAQYDPTELATPQAFQKDPKKVWDWYAYRRELVAQTQPNPGHYAIAELEKLLPKVVLVTQNIDQHHQTAGSQDIIRLHGNLFAYKCSANCQGDPTPIDFESLPLSEETPPHCPHCQTGYARPDVVWFGEGLPETGLARAKEEAKNCDVMLVVGTSGAVYPAAWLPLKAAEKGAFLIEVNPNPSEFSRAMNIRLEAPSGEVLPKVVAEVRKILGVA